MDERNTNDLAEGPLPTADRPRKAAWAQSSVVTEEERWRAGLQNEIRPLVERCRRLRDRGLLD